MRKTNCQSGDEKKEGKTNIRRSTSVSRNMRWVMPFGRTCGLFISFVLFLLF
jgi:hypothetical protein